MVRLRLPLLIAFIAMLGAATACGSTGPSFQDGVLGTWRWVESTGGIAGVTLTPASTGDSMTLRFRAGGEVQLFQNGILVREVGFIVGAGPAQGALEIFYDEPLMGFATQIATFPSSQDLVLTDPCCDGFVHSYVRVP